MSAGEAALSGYCCVAALTLRGIGPCRKEGLQEQVRKRNRKGSFHTLVVLKGVSLKAQLLNPPSPAAGGTDRP